MPPPKTFRAISSENPARARAARSLRWRSALTAPFRNGPSLRRRAKVSAARNSAFPPPSSLSLFAIAPSMTTDIRPFNLNRWRHAGSFAPPDPQRKTGFPELHGANGFAAPGANNVRRRQTGRGKKWLLSTGFPPSGLLPGPYSKGEEIFS